MKSLLIKLGLGILVISFAMPFQSCENYSKTGPPDLSSATHSFIRKDSANKMISSYLESLDTQPGQLYSLIFDADDLRHYLSDASVKHVKAMFAHNLDYINNGNEGLPAGYDADALTLVLAGYDSEENYVLVNNDYVINRAVRCPTFCPVAGSAQNNIIE